MSLFYVLEHFNRQGDVDLHMLEANAPWIFMFIMGKIAFVTTMLLWKEYPLSLHFSFKIFMYHTSVTGRKIISVVFDQ